MIDAELSFKALCRLPARNCHYAGIVYQDVQPGQVAAECFGAATHGLQVRQVELYYFKLSLRQTLEYLCLGLFGPWNRAAGKQNAGAFDGQSQGSMKAKAAVCSRNESNPVCLIGNVGAAPF